MHTQLLHPFLSPLPPPATLALPTIYHLSFLSQLCIYIQKDSEYYMHCIQFVCLCECVCVGVGVFKALDVG